jgi:HSP90 family molecular chaperone
LMQLKEYKEHPFENIAGAELPEAEEGEAEDTEKPDLDEKAVSGLVERVKAVLGERVDDVRTTKRLVDSPARLVDPEGAPDQSMQRVYQMMDKSFKLPKKVLELNPRHPIIAGLAELPEEDSRFRLVTEQIYENTLLIEGLHPDPVSMVGRIQDLISSALEKKPES